MTKIHYTKELIESTVKESKSITDVLKKLDLVTRGGNFHTIKKKINFYNVDISHFTGQGWSKGLTVETSETVKRITEKNTKHSPETSLIDGVNLTTSTLQRLLDIIERQKVCVICGLTDEWQNKKLTLHIDHENGVHTDNRPENIRYLCPNCHSQTPTFGKNS